MKGTIAKYDAVLKGSIKPQARLKAAVRIPEVIKGIADDVEVYTGDYDVIPKVSPQSLETAEKLLTKDVTIEAIPYYEVSNSSGGVTVIIGG